MFDKFCRDLIWYTTVAENKNEDGTVNWNFIDSDMYMKWSVLLDGETYTEWFDEAADIADNMEDPKRYLDFVKLNKCS
jgi:hypothetical protein